MKIHNERLAVAQRFFGKHFEPGCAGGYDDGTKTIFINQDTAKKMNTTFQGCPVYVEHVHKVDPDNKDGVVVRAFYNEKDGQHWVEFMVDTTEGLEKIKQGWKLSNAYHPLSVGAGNDANGVPYDQQILDAQYEHLAIVESPRYNGSVILTPKEFEAYNSNKDMDLKTFMNSRKTMEEEQPTKKPGEKSMFELFKKTKVENSKDLESMSVTLPKSKVEKTLTQVINAADEVEMEKSKKPEDRMANGDDMIECYKGKMKVNDLISAYNTMIAEADKAKNDDMDDDTAMNEKEDEDKKENADDEDEKAKEKEKEKKENAAKAILNKQGKAFYDQLKKAESKHVEKISNEKAEVIELTIDKVARGKQLYGSKK